MARYKNVIPTQKPVEWLNQAIGQYLASEGFEYTAFKGEQVFRKGTGVMTSPQIIKIGYGQGTVLLEAWIPFALLPGVYTGEMGLKGFYGWALKSMLRTRVQALEQIIFN